MLEWSHVLYCPEVGSVSGPNRSPIDDAVAGLAGSLVTPVRPRDEDRKRIDPTHPTLILARHRLLMWKASRQCQRRRDDRASSTGASSDRSCPDHTLPHPVQSPRPTPARLQRGAGRHYSPVQPPPPPPGGRGASGPLNIPSPSRRGAPEPAPHPPPAPTGGPAIPIKVVFMTPAYPP